MSLRKAFMAMAVGDALGADFEFEPRTTPAQLFNANRSKSVLRITDDTQMSLFGLEAVTRYLEHDGSLPGLIKQAYLDWYETQRRPEPYDPSKGGLLSKRFMYSTRAPGLTCMKSLGELANGLFPKNHSNGCGAVMRLLPFVALLPHQEAYTTACYASMLTHGGDEIVPSSYTFMSVADSLMRKTFHPLANALALIDNPVKLGSGWTANSCLLRALHAVIKAPTFIGVMEEAICAVDDTDSDSVAAVAGAFWGLKGGEVHESLWRRVREHKLIEEQLNEYERVVGAHAG